MSQFATHPISHELGPSDGALFDSFASGWTDVGHRRPAAASV